MQIINFLDRFLFLIIKTCIVFGVSFNSPLGDFKLSRTTLGSGEIINLMSQSLFVCLFA